MLPRTPDQFVVPLSRVKISLILLGSAAFVTASLWLWMNADLIPRRNPLYIQGVAALGMAFSGLCGLYAFFKFFDSAPGLIIDAHGIVDNSSGVSAGRIPWSDIQGFRTMTVQRQRFLTIDVKDPDKYIQRAPFLKRQLVGLNAKYFGGPIQISANTLKINFDELFKVANDFFEKYRQA
jgi:hypothetical protein